MIMKVKYIVSALVSVCFAFQAPAQKYQVIDKTVAVVGGEMIPISEIESEIQMRRAQGMSSDRNMRCELLESMLESKLEDIKNLFGYGNPIILTKRPNRGKYMTNYLHTFIGLRGFNMRLSKR